MQIWERTKTFNLLIMTVCDLTNLLKYKTDTNIKWINDTNITQCGEKFWYFKGTPKYLAFEYEKMTNKL